MCRIMELGYNFLIFFIQSIVSIFYVHGVLRICLLETIASPLA